MMTQEKHTTSYTPTKRFLRDFPGWFETVRACVRVAERTKGEFAGAWALDEARKFGIEWIPNLRPLAGYGILRRTDVSRGGRRAYYVMEDIQGVKAAVVELEQEINAAATEAIGNAMYRRTYGIVGDGRGGAEGRGLGTGVGVRWKDNYLMLTAAHVLQQTPHERLYFLLPSDILVHPSSSIPTRQGTVELRKRFVLANPQVLLSDHLDLAAVILDPQPPEIGKHHFYEADEAYATPSIATEVGFLGYPGESSVPIGQNFMANVYYDFGRIGEVPAGYDHKSQISVSYPMENAIDPHGLSGSGLWFSPPARKKIWEPDVSLVGLLTAYDRDLQVLIGYKVEKVIEFLKSKDQWMPDIPHEG